MKRLLWWLIAGSRGGANRAVMIRALKERPYNAHQLSEALKLDYKTVRHHLKVLAENNVVVASGPSRRSGPDASPDAPTPGKEQYGAMWFLSPMMESHYADFLDILQQVKLDGA
jgi:DNA-binding transcriptional ArsR family regulator